MKRLDEHVAVVDKYKQYRTLKMQCESVLVRLYHLEKFPHKAPEKKKEGEEEESDDDDSEDGKKKDV